MRRFFICAYALTVAFSGVKFGFGAELVEGVVLSDEESSALGVLFEIDEFDSSRVTLKDEGTKITAGGFNRDLMRALNNFQKITFSKAVFEDEDNVPNLHEFSRLQNLSLEGSDVQAQWLNGKLPTQLRELSLKGCKRLGGLPNLSKVTSSEFVLNLSETEADDSWFANWSKVGFPPCCEITLLLNDCKQLKSIENIKSIEKLRVLYLNRTTVAARWLVGLPGSLVRLYLDGCTELKGFPVGLDKLKTLSILRSAVPILPDNASLVKDAASGKSGAVTALLKALGKPGESSDGDLVKALKLLRDKLLLLARTLTKSRPVSSVVGRRVQ